MSRGVYVRGVSVQGGICPEVSVRGVHVQGGIVLSPYRFIVLKKSFLLPFRMG